MWKDVVHLINSDRRVDEVIREIIIKTLCFDYSIIINEKLYSMFSIIDTQVTAAVPSPISTIEL